MYSKARDRMRGIRSTTEEGIRQRAANGGCVTCYHFGGWRSSVLRNGVTHTITDSNALCLRSHIVWLHALAGCESWEREVGADDGL